MIITVKNEFIEFKTYPSSSIFVEFKKEVGESIEVAIQNEKNDKFEMIGKLIFLGHKAYSRLSNTQIVVTEAKILDAITLNELTDLMNKFMGADPKGDKKK